MRTAAEPEPEPGSGPGKLSEPALLVLVSLSAGPRHGYAIRDDIEDVAGVSLGPGTLYGAIGRLEHRGLIDALPADERRKPYRITDAGTAALRRHLAGMKAVVDTGLGRLAATRIAGHRRPAPGA